VTDQDQISALTGGSEPEFVGNLYTYLIQKPRYSTAKSRQQLVRRLREALIKCVSIVGVCKPIEAIFQIAEIERPEDKDYSFSRSVLLSSNPVTPYMGILNYLLLGGYSEHWQSGEENKARGLAWLDQIYKHNRTNTINNFAAHKDFGNFYSLPCPLSPSHKATSPFYRGQTVYTLLYSLGLCQHNLWSLPF